MRKAYPFAHAQGAGWRAVADQCLGGLGDAPRTGLGFLYATDQLAGDMNALLDHFRTHTGVEHWIGTIGMGISATGREYFDVPAIAVMIADLPAGSYHVLDAVADPDAVPEAVRQLIDSPHFAILHGDPTNAQLPDLIARCAGSMASGFVVGGLTSSRAANVQVADHLTEGGISGVVFDERVGVVTRLTQGCSPIGQHHEVSECRRNILIQLDGRPALEVFKEDIGEVLARDLDRVAGYIFAGFPIAGSDTGDYLVRNLVGIDVNNNLIAVGEMLETNQPIMFCRRDGESAREDMERMLSAISGSLSGTPRGGVYYSCLGRGPNLFGAESQELRMIRDALGEFPLVGFFANGEISHDRLYGYTGVLTLFT